MEEAYKAYSKRWLVLFAVCILNFSNATMWVTFAPISYYTNSYYCAGCNYVATLLNVIFMICSIPFGFLAMFTLDRFGLRVGILIGAWINLIGSLLRVVSSIDSLPQHWRLISVLLGQTLAASAQPFIMFLPTKTASLWFPSNQRALANTFASMANPLGVASIYPLSPLIVNERAPRNFLMLNGLVSSLALLGAICSLTVTSSQPPTPAAASSRTQSLSFFAGLKKVTKIRSYIVLVICQGGGIGLFNCLYNNLQPTLCVKGYSNEYSGMLGSAMIFCGFLGSTFSGLYVDRTKKFALTMKCSLGMAALFACSYAIVSQYEKRDCLLALSVCLFGLCAFSVYAIGMEMAVETTYPVAEATSSGLIVISGQVQGIISVAITGFLAQRLAETPANQTCNQVAGTGEVLLFNWKWSGVAWASMAVTLVSAFILLFRPKHKRIDYERSKAANTAENEEKNGQVFAVKL